MGSMEGEEGLVIAFELVPVTPIDPDNKFAIAVCPELDSMNFIYEFYNHSLVKNIKLVC
jgi:hypothetical protein